MIIVRYIKKQFFTIILLGNIKKKKNYRIYKNNEIRTRTVKPIYLLNLFIHTLVYEHRKVHHIFIVSVYYYYVYVV